MRTSTLAFALASWVTTALSGCSSDSPGSNQSELQQTLGTALDVGSALGRAAQLAAEAINAPGGSTSSCVAVSAACTSYPCSGAASITLGPGCDLPFGGSASGTVSVTGSFSAATKGQLTTSFTAAKAGGVAVAVVSAQNLSVDKSGDLVTVRYVGQDVSTQSGTLAAQSVWTVVIDSAGTDATGDDILTVDGTDQTVAGATVLQLNVRDARFEPSCQRNPISGSATVQKVGGLSIQQDQITFHATCDGEADVRGISGGTHSEPLRQEPPAR